VEGLGALPLPRPYPNLSPWPRAPAIANDCAVDALDPWCPVHGRDAVTLPPLGPRRRRRRLVPDVGGRGDGAVMPWRLLIELAGPDIACYVAWRAYSPIDRLP